MEEIVIKSKCTGCTACMNGCPKQAISMETDNNGFKHPVIDQTKCINCGLCKKNCPVLNTINNESINECYVAFSNDDNILNNSSSGGLFNIIANKVLDNNGIVIGAAFDNTNTLKHIAVTSKNDLEPLKGSKYLQSDLTNIFIYIKENIKNKQILFVGTPCQVAGLKSYIKNNNNLICLDIVCHGVPSPKLFEKYIKELETINKQKVIKFNFRDKSTGWDTYSNTVTFENKAITELAKNNKYMKLFLANIALRESCYNCNFKLGNKYSDITLGDFWGINNVNKNMYNKKGTSAIIINTNQGKELFESIKNELTYKKCELSDILLGNSSLKESSKEPIKRNEFFSNIETESMDEEVSKYVPKTSFIKKMLRKVKKIIKQ